MKHRAPENISFLSNFHFDKLEIIVKDENDLQYIKAKNLTLNLETERYFHIDQNHIDNIGCNSLDITHGRINITGDIEINTLQVLTTNTHNIGIIKSKHLTIIVFMISQLLESLNIDFHTLKTFSYVEVNTIEKSDWFYNSLNKFRFLSKLKLRGGDVTGNLKYFSKIQHISLIRCKFEENELLHLKDCEYLDLSQTNIEGVNIGQLNCKSLNLSDCLNIDTNNFYEKEFEYLNLKVDKNKDYHHLSVIPFSRNLILKGRTEIIDEHLEDLSATRKIDLRDCNIIGHGLHYLENCEILYISYADKIESVVNDLDFEEVYICMKIFLYGINKDYHSLMSLWVNINDHKYLFDMKRTYFDFCCFDGIFGIPICEKCVTSF